MEELSVAVAADPQWEVEWDSPITSFSVILLGSQNNIG